MYISKAVLVGNIISDFEKRYDKGGFNYRLLVEVESGDIGETMIFPVFFTERQMNQIKARLEDSSNNFSQMISIVGMLHSIKFKENNYTLRVLCKNYNFL